MEEIKKKLQAEIDDLEHQLNHEIPKVIQHAREFGFTSSSACSGVSSP